MSLGVIELNRPELELVDKKIIKAFKIKAGHLDRFAHLGYKPLAKHIRPSLVLLTSRVFGHTGEQVIDLAAVIQFIFMAADVHFGISDIDRDPKENGQLDPRDGSQIPVLVGDYLYGKFFTTLCAANLLEFLDPLAQIIAEINLGGMLRKQHTDLDSNDPKYLEIIQKETAVLFAGACRLSAILANAKAAHVHMAADFGLNLGMAYGIMERCNETGQAELYLIKAMENIEGLPAGRGRDYLRELVQTLMEDAKTVPERRLGQELALGDGRKKAQNILTGTAKEKKVQGFFDSIAKKYDIMNSLMSLGRHHYWRKFTVGKTELPAGGLALDVCCGTGMVTMDLAKKAGPEGKVIGLDFSEKMLAVAGEYLQNFPLKDNIELIQGNAMELPFPDNTFDCATVVYGLRNLPDMKKGLAEMMRVVKPGGRVVSLEFAKPYVPLFKQLYYFYIEVWIPFLGKINARNRDAYQYLHDSIRAYPHQHVVTDIYRNMGFIEPQCYELTGGVVALHVGIKPEEEGQK